jgi:hypothetical protein
MHLSCPWPDATVQIKRELEPKCVGQLEMPLGHLQRADANDHPASERVRADRKMGKSHPSGPTQTAKGGPADPFPAQMWERNG